METRSRRQFLKQSAALALSLAAGAGAAAEESRKAPLARPASPAAPLGVIALNRAAFGPRPGDLEDFDRLGATPGRRLAAFVERQLHPESISDSDCEARLAAADLPTLKKSLRQLWTDHHLATDKLRDEQKDADDKRGAQMRADEQQLRHQPVREVELAAWIRAVHSRRQLQEVLVDYWHGHFNVYGWDQPICSLFTQFDRDVIRPHALGNFRQMLEAVAQSPAMLFYLDGFVNQSGNPNENYARELFELHTMGAEHYLGTMDRRQVPGYAQGKPVGYVDGDVYEAARCFTGWKVDQGGGSGNTGEFVYFESWHDRFQKIVLGRQLEEYQPPLKDGRMVLDLLAAHPATARHVCLRLCRRLVSDEPSRPLVESAAAVFLKNRKNPHQLRAVVRSILLSEEFRRTWGAKIKRPFEASVSALRAVGADFAPTEPFLGRQAQEGQRLFQWRTPDGYPDTREKWASTTPLVLRWKLFHALAAGNLPGAKLDVAAQTPPKASAAAVVELWSRRLLGRALSAERARVIAAFLAQGEDTSRPHARPRLAAAVALILMSPDLQWR